MILRNSPHARYAQYEKYYRRNRVAAFQSRRNHFVVIYVSKVMSNVMLVYWVPKIMMLAAIKTANCAVIRVLSVVIRIHLAARIANLCRLVSNVVSRCMQHAKGRLVVPELMQNAPNHQQWMMALYARSEDNVEMANAVCSIQQLININ